MSKSTSMSAAPVCLKEPSSDQRFRAMNRAPGVHHVISEQGYLSMAMSIHATSSTHHSEVLSLRLDETGHMALDLTLISIPNLLAHASDPYYCFEYLKFDWMTVMRGTMSGASMPGSPLSGSLIAKI